MNFLIIFPFIMDFFEGGAIFGICNCPLQFLIFVYLPFQCLFILCHYIGDSVKSNFSDFVWEPHHVFQASGPHPWKGNENQVLLLSLRMVLADKSWQRWLSGLYSPTWGSFSPPSLLHQVELIPGNCSVLYGVGSSDGQASIGSGTLFIPVAC